MWKMKAARILSEVLTISSVFRQHAAAGSLKSTATLGIVAEQTLS